MGDRVTVFGQLATVSNERTVNVQALEIVSTSQPVPGPLGIPNRSANCGDRNEYTPGMTGGSGLNVVGLLVRIWGTVTYVGDGYFYVDDGSGLDDGLGAIGIEVRDGALNEPSVGDYVTLTGIMRAGVISSTMDVVPYMWLRTQSDIVVVE